jgi:hypothetical protein
MMETTPPPSCQPNPDKFVSPDSGRRPVCGSLKVSSY